MQLVSPYPMKLTFLCGDCCMFCSLYLDHPLPVLHHLLKPWSSFELHIKYYLLYKAFHNITIYAFLCISVVCFAISSVSSVAQSCPTLRPHELQHARPPCPSPIPGVYPNSGPLSWWCLPTISSSVIPFSSCPHSLPASESFPMSQLFTQFRCTWRKTVCNSEDEWMPYARWIPEANPGWIFFNINVFILIGG